MLMGIDQSSANPGALDPIRNSYMVLCQNIRGKRQEKIISLTRGTLAGNQTYYIISGGVTELAGSFRPWPPIS